VVKDKSKTSTFCGQVAEFHAYKAELPAIWLNSRGENRGGNSPSDVAIPLFGKTAPDNRLYSGMARPVSPYSHASAGF
jgi:hypothetical protein